MTRYLLNSGGVKRHPARQRRFHQAMVAGHGSAPHILICSFAQPREVWEGKFPGYCQAITKDLPAGLKPKFTLAFPDQFAAQCQQADAVYLNGGDDHLVQYWLRQFELPKIWEHCTVATNSASSDALAVSFWTCDWRKCMDGLGLLPIKFMPHYGSTAMDDDPRGPIDWPDARRELAAYGNQRLPIVAEPEGVFASYEL